MRAVDYRTLPIIHLTIVWKQFEQLCAVLKENSLLQTQLLAKQTETARLVAENEERRRQEVTDGRFKKQEDQTHGGMFEQ